VDQVDTSEIEVMFKRCCGLDVHKKSIAACIIVPGSSNQPTKEILTFGTTTREIRRLMETLTTRGVTHVGMESTGSYWRPIWNMLEGEFYVLLANAREVKALPGRKTDVKDCEWIARLLRCGLLPSSFVPDRPQRELRDLTRYRTSLIEEHSAEVNRIQKMLEGANIKLASVASNIMGLSGRQILRKLLSGSKDAAAMAELAKGRLREKIPQLQEALEGSFGAHHRFMVAKQLAHIDFLDQSIETFDQEVATRLSPFDELIERLDAIPGLGRRAAEIILGEIGTDMSRFPSAKNLASWAGVSPGNNESAGKRRSTKTKKGNHALRRILVQVAHAASHTKGTYLAAHFARLAARKGAKNAAMAVGHSILVIIYNMIKRGTTYEDLGGNYFQARDRQAKERRFVNGLKALGYKVTLELEETRPMEEPHEDAA